jgi:predicted lipoprotein with Yx(FWY)xxD motif
MRTGFTLAGLAACLFAAAARADLETPADAAVTELGHGTRITDAEGLTLYTFDTDLREPGASMCTGECAAMRPPLLADRVPDNPPEDWSVIARDDGTLQWAHKGRPLYRYARDLDAGAAFGAGNGWNVAFEPSLTPAELSVTDTVIGQVLSTSDGRTLYVRGGDTGPDFVCDGACAQSWRPVEAPWTARDFDAFSVLTRADGLYQWAYDGKALFTYAGDASPGDLNGHDTNGVWQALVLEPAPPVPDWVTVVVSDGGDLYADSGGMTLYRLMIDDNATEQAYIGGNHCDEACLKKYWTPVSANGPLPRVGHWSVIADGTGGWQWAYQGMPLFLLNAETRPGQLYYTTYRQFQWMKPIMYALPSLQGVF